MARKPKPQCPNCKQYRLDEKRGIWLLLASGCFFGPLMVASVLFITIIGIPIALFFLGLYIITIPLGIIAIIVAFRTHGYRCRNCHWVGDNPIIESA